MLLLGALTSTNPVADGFGVFDLSLDNFLTVLANPNVHVAAQLAHRLHRRLATAVAIGLAFSWIVVRTNTPCKRFIGAAGLIPLFVPPLVAGVAWSILGSPKSGLINTMMKWAGLDWRIDLYSMAGLILVFGMYYAPYVYMFRPRRCATWIPVWRKPPRSRVSVRCAPCSPSLSPSLRRRSSPACCYLFVVMLGIYGIPAVLGTPANIQCSPPIFSC